MGLDEMTKNDMAAIEHMLSGDSSICGKCGVRVNPNRCSWRTCTEVDKMYTCQLCIEEEKNNSNVCPSCERTTGNKGLCNDCQLDRCKRHSMVLSPHILNQDFGMWPTYKKEIPTCSDCRYWYERNPKDYLARIKGIYDEVRPELLELRKRLRQYCNRYLHMDMVYNKPGVITRYRGPIVDKDVCHYCGWQDTGAHGPVDLLFYQGTRYHFCNRYRKDYQGCYEKWRDENNMHCEVEYDGLRCVLLKDSPEGYKHCHEFVIWEDKKRVKWIFTTLDMEVTYHYEKELGMIVGGDEDD
jgi:hypothetical protein